MVIILKCTEILKHYVVYHELTCCCKSIILQNNKLIEQEIRFVVTEVGIGGSWMKMVKKYKLPVINKYWGYNVEYD